jgi:hypothetical protein
MTKAESHGDEQNPGRTAYLAELQCFMCGSTAGSIESERKPLTPYGIWHPASGGALHRIADWRQLRCNRCGGALFAENVEAVIRNDDADELRRDAPRRGRPPKWLVEQRRKDRDATDARLG